MLPRIRASNAGDLANVAAHGAQPRGGQNPSFCPPPGGGARAQAAAIGLPPTAVPLVRVRCLLNGICGAAGRLHARTGSIGRVPARSGARSAPYIRVQGHGLHAGTAERIPPPAMQRLCILVLEKISLHYKASIITAMTPRPWACRWSVTLKAVGWRQDGSGAGVLVAHQRGGVDGDGGWIMGRSGCAGGACLRAEIGHLRRAHAAALRWSNPLRALLSHQRPHLAGCLWLSSRGAGVLHTAITPQRGHSGAEDSRCGVDRALQEKPANRVRTRCPARVGPAAPGRRAAASPGAAPPHGCVAHTAGS
jgi:hypothetical protein